MSGKTYKAANVITDFSLDDVELVEPDSLIYTFSTVRGSDIPAALIEELCGPGKRYPHLYVDHEICWNDDLNGLHCFQQEYLDRVCPEGTELSDEDDAIVGQAQTLFDAASYAATFGRWSLSRKRLAQAEDLLVKNFPNVFPTCSSNLQSMRR